MSTTFQNKWDSYDKVCYHGMEQHFYLKESAGPGAYLSQDEIYEESTKKKTEQWSVPKKDRGLLSAPQ